MRWYSIGSWLKINKKAQGLSINSIIVFVSLSIISALISFVDLKDVMMFGKFEDE